MKLLIRFLSLMVCSFTMYAANPAFTDFSSQFSTTGNKVRFVGPLTNVTLLNNTLASNLTSGSITVSNVLRWSNAFGGTLTITNSITASNFVGAVGAGTGGTGGILNLNGGDGLSGFAGGNGGSISLRGGDGDGSAVGGAAGLIFGRGGVAVGGNAGAAAGTLNLSASNEFAGGSINLRAGASAAGGSITANNGGGSIDLTGTGSIQFGVAATRTTLSGTGTSARAISLPDADGTLALTSGLVSFNQTQFHTNAGLVQLTNGFRGTNPVLDGATVTNATLEGTVTNNAVFTRIFVPLITNSGSIAIRPATAAGQSKFDFYPGGGTPQFTVTSAARSLANLAGTGGTELCYSSEGSFFIGFDTYANLSSGSSVGGTVAWQFNGSGHMLSAADNTYDLGIGGRPRNLSVGTAVTVGGAITATNGYGTRLQMLGTEGNVTNMIVAGRTNLASGERDVFTTAATNNMVVMLTYVNSGTITLNGTLTHDRTLTTNGVSFHVESSSGATDTNEFAWFIVLPPQ